MTNMEVAASLMMQLGTTSKVYMINKASYGSEAEAREAAKAVVGQTGSKGALGLQVITAGSADQGAIDAMAKSLTTAVSFATPFPPPFNLQFHHGGARRRRAVARRRPAPTGWDQGCARRQGALAPQLPRVTRCCSSSIHEVRKHRLITFFQIETGSTRICVTYALIHLVVCGMVFLGCFGRAKVQWLEPRKNRG